MLSFILSVLLATAFFGVFLAWVRHRLEPKGTENVYTVYRIQFQNSLDKVNILQSKQISSHVTIAAEDKNGYIVHSDINDRMLKQLIKEEFNLKSSQFIVTSKQFMNFQSRVFY